MLDRVDRQGGTYPRRGEPIVPRLLRGVVLERRASTVRPDPETELLVRVDLGPAAWNHLPAETCRRISFTVIDRVRTRLPGLSEIVRETELPPPTMAVRLPLERRTLNTLRRAIRREPTDGRWTIARYLAMRRFGARALIDLLACLEAGMVARQTLGSTQRNAVDVRAFLREVLLFLAPRVPISARQVNSELVREGRIVQPLDFGRVVRQALDLGWDAPFRIVDIGGSPVIIRLSQVSAAKAVYRTALRILRSRGATTIGTVAAQVTATEEAAFREGFVLRLLMSLENFRWLSEDDRWFWLIGRANPLLRAVRKVLSVTGRLTLLRLWRALFRAARPSPSPEAITMIAAAAPEASIVDDCIRATRLVDPDQQLSRGEKEVLKLMSSVGRPLSDSELHGLARAAGLQWPKIQRVLAESPIIERSQDDLYHLIGQW